VLSHPPHAQPRRLTSSSRRSFFVSRRRFVASRDKHYRLTSCLTPQIPSLTTSASSRQHEFVSHLTSHRDFVVSFCSRRSLVVSHPLRTATSSSRVSLALWLQCLTSYLTPQLRLLTPLVSRQRTSSSHVLRTPQFRCSTPPPPRDVGFCRVTSSSSRQTSSSRILFTAQLRRHTSSLREWLSSRAPHPIAVSSSHVPPHTKHRRVTSSHRKLRRRTPPSCGNFIFHILLPPDAAAFVASHPSSRRNIIVSHPAHGFVLIHLSSCRSVVLSRPPHAKTLSSRILFTRRIHRLTSTSRATASSRQPSSSHIPFSTRNLVVSHLPHSKASSSRAPASCGKPIVSHPPYAAASSLTFYSLATPSSIHGPPHVVALSSYILLTSQRHAPHPPSRGNTTVSQPSHAAASTPHVLFTLHLNRLTRGFVVSRPPPLLASSRQHFLLSHPHTAHLFVVSHLSRAITTSSYPTSSSRQSRRLMSLLTPQPRRLTSSSRRSFVVSHLPLVVDSPSQAHNIIVSHLSRVAASSSHLLLAATSLSHILFALQLRRINSPLLPKSLTSRVHLVWQFVVARLPYTAASRLTSFSHCKRCRLVSTSHRSFVVAHLLMS
jgi:hypothetical protein